MAYMTGQTVFIYPSMGLADSRRLQGKRAKVRETYKTKQRGHRIVVELLDGDPRPIFSRTPDGILYLDIDEVSSVRRPK